MARKIIKGEKRLIGQQVIHREGDEFEIEGAPQYRLLDYAGEEIESGNCNIEEKKVYFLLDTTQEKIEPGKDYRAVFTVEISDMDKVLKGVTTIKVRSP